MEALLDLVQQCCCPWYLGELCDIFMRASRGLKLAPGREIIGAAAFLSKTLDTQR